MQVDSGGRSIHNYWLLNSPISGQQFTELQARLAEHCGSDSTLINPSRVMRLPGPCRGDGTPVQLISSTRERHVHV